MNADPPGDAGSKPPDLTIDLTQESQTPAQTSGSGAPAPPPAPPPPQAAPPPPAPPPPPQPFEQVQAHIPTLSVTGSLPSAVFQPYVPERRRDWVRMIVTVGLLTMYGCVVLWACVESRSWPDHWNQTKEMLQIVLPAVTGLIGPVIGFYFGSGMSGSNSGSSIGTQK